MPADYLPEQAGRGIEPHCGAVAPSEGPVILPVPQAAAPEVLRSSRIVPNSADMTKQ